MVNRFVYAIIAFCLLIAVFIFALDPLVNAVGLRAIYRPFGMAVGVVSFVLIPFAIRYERMRPVVRLTYLVVTLFVGILAATPLSLFLILVGWFTSLATGAIFIPANIIMIGFGAVMVTIIVLSLFYPKTKSTLKFIMVLLLLYSSGYFIGIAATPAYAEAEMPDQLVYNEHQYFLYLHWGWLGDPDTLLLYECNSWGIYCDVIYRAPTGYYREHDLFISVDTETQVVGASIDGQISPLELKAEDVQFLCDFFEASAGDRFCTNPMYADFSGFWDMLRNKERTFTYQGILAYFDTEERKKCLTSEQDLPADTKTYTCVLSFPNRSFYLELRLIRDNYSGDLGTYVKLTNEKKA